VFLAAGIVLGLVAFVRIGPLFNDLLNAEQQAVPGRFEVDLEVGDWLVSERIGSTSTFGSLTITEAMIGTVEAVTVTGPAGQQVPTTSGSAQTVTIEDRIYIGTARFEAVQAGTYIIEVDAAEPTDVIVTPSLIGNLGSFFGGAALATLAGICGLAAFVLLVVGFATRNRRPASGAGQPA
jgi:hypothetical protein